MLQKRCKFITNFSSTSIFLSFFYILSEIFFATPRIIHLKHTITH